MSKKIASIILNWNMERFLVPHIEMLKPHTDKIIFVQCTRPFEPYRLEHGYSKTPDNSESIVREKYPEIEIFNYEPEDSDPTMMFSNAWNFGMSKLEDYDLVTKFDVDQFFTQSDLKEIFKYIKSKDIQNFGLDWRYQSVNYYYSMDYGLKDQLEQDPLIVNPKYKFSKLLMYPFLTHIMPLDVTMHHFRNFKKWCTKEWVEGKKPSPYGIYSQDLLNKYNNGKWVKTPKEIKELFNETIN